MFRAIDGDSDGRLSASEFQKGLDAPASLTFKAADRNSDGRLTEDEAGTAIAHS